MNERFCLPTIRSPSQWPGTARSCDLRRALGDRDHVPDAALAGGPAARLAPGAAAAQIAASGPCAAGRATAHRATGRSSRARSASPRRRDSRASVWPRSAAARSAARASPPPPGAASGSTASFEPLGPQRGQAGAIVGPRRPIAPRPATPPTSRLTVDGALPIRRAIARNESPAAIPARISSRSPATTAAASAAYAANAATAYRQPPPAPCAPSCSVVPTARATCGCVSPASDPLKDLQPLPRDSRRLPNSPDTLPHSPSSPINTTTRCCVDRWTPPGLCPTWTGRFEDSVVESWIGVAIRPQGRTLRGNRPRRPRRLPYPAAVDDAGRRSTATSPRRRTARRLIVSVSTVPTRVSTTLVPTKKAASWPAGTAGPVTGAKVAASMAAPAPTETGERDEPAAALRRGDEQHGGERGGQAEGGEEAGERAEPADAAGDLPREHAARVGARALERRAATADAAATARSRGVRATTAAISAVPITAGTIQISRARRTPARGRRSRRPRAAPRRRAARPRPRPRSSRPAASSRRSRRRSSSTRTASPARAEARPPAPAPATQAATASRRRTCSPLASRSSVHQPRPRATWLARCSTTPRTSHPSDTPVSASVKLPSACSRAAASSAAASHMLSRSYPRIPPLSSNPCGKRIRPAR